MTVPSLLDEPGRVDEPRGAQEYSAVLTQVAVERRPVIVRRNGTDLAAVIPLEHLELLQDVLARQEAERLAAQIDWDRLVKTNRPPQEWFDGEQKAGRLRADIPWIELGRFVTSVLNGLALRIAGGDPFDIDAMLVLLNDAIRPQG